MLGNPLLLGAEDSYTISRSLRLRSSASAFLSRTPAGAGNRKTWTWSGWVKLSAIGVSRGHGLLSVGTGANGTTGFDFRVNDSTDGSIRIEEALFGTTTYCVLITTPVYRDPSAWYHIVLSVDTTQATSSDRVKLYVNGSQVTSFSSSTYPSLNYDYLVSSATQHNMGVSKANGVTTYADEYLTEINFIGGQALTPSSFGETDATTGA